MEDLLLKKIIFHVSKMWRLFFPIGDYLIHLHQITQKILGSCTVILFLFYKSLEHAIFSHIVDSKHGAVSSGRSPYFAFGVFQTHHQFFFDKHCTQIQCIKIIP